MTDTREQTETKAVVEALADVGQRVRQAAGRIMILEARNGELQKALEHQVNTLADTVNLLQGYMRHVAHHMKDVPVPDAPSEFLTAEDIDALWRLR